MTKKVEIVNKQLNHEYFIEHILECGIALKGNEVKSIRNGAVSIKDAWCAIQNNELVVRGMHVSKYKFTNSYDLEDEDRERVLLAHKKEIRKLKDIVKQDGYTLKVVKLYFNERGKCKILLGVCKGKHNYDKRESIKKRDTEREIRRSFTRKEKKY